MHVSQIIRKLKKFKKKLEKNANDIFEGKFKCFIMLRFIDIHFGRDFLMLSYAITCELDTMKNLIVEKKVNLVLFEFVNLMEKHPPSCGGCY